MSDPVPKRRWFRFRLRTLFVVVTVLSCWLGYQISWIRQRHVFLASEHGTANSLGVPAGNGGKQIAPWPLWAFGESGAMGVFIVAKSPSVDALTKYDQDRISEARRLFPEASIFTMHVETTADGLTVQLSGNRR